LFSSNDDLIGGWPLASEYESTMALHRRTHESVFSFLGDERATSISIPNNKHAGSDDVEAGLFNASSPGGITTWSFDSTFDDFKQVKGQNGREKSMFVDFFMKDEQEPKMVNEKNASSSTAAAIASSSDKIGSDNNSDVDTRLEIDFLNPIGGSTTQILTDMAEAEYLIIGKFSAETVTYGAPLECLMVECSESIGYFSPTSPFMIEDHFKTC
jgi:hypothetical protein